MRPRESIRRFLCVLGQPTSSLNEDVWPEEDGPVYRIDATAARTFDRAPMWIAVPNMCLLILTLASPLVIAFGGEGTGLLVWQAAVGAVGAVSASATTYYLRRRPDVRLGPIPSMPAAGEPAAPIRVEPAPAPAPTSAAAPPSDPAPAQLEVPTPTPAAPATVRRLDKPILSVALIGSFRRHYEEVKQAAAEFTAAGVHVLSPAIATIINPGADFVRFDIDPEASSDADLQEQALRRILAADFVFVVAPGGYIGRTTCYELGQVLLDGSIPVFFSDPLEDLPIRMPVARIRRAADLAREVAEHGRKALTRPGMVAAG